MKNISEARRVYLEQYGSALVTNSYLRIALVAQSVVLVGAVGLALWTFAWAKAQKPLVVKISDGGEASVVNSGASEYHPDDGVLRHFLAQFVSLHFSRRIAMLEENFGRSLYYLDRKLSQTVMEQEQKTQSLPKFRREESEEIDAVVNNVSLQDVRAVPMKATVDFEKVYFSRVDHRELRREKYSGYFEFVVLPSVPPSIAIVNPLGLTITYFRTDQAYR